MVLVIVVGRELGSYLQRGFYEKAKSSERRYAISRHCLWFVIAGDFPRDLPSCRELPSSTIPITRKLHNNAVHANVANSIVIIHPIAKVRVMRFSNGLTEIADWSSSPGQNFGMKSSASETYVSPLEADWTDLRDSVV